MDSEDLTTDQAKAVRQSLQGSLSYLHRLQRRMEKAGFPIDDPLFLRVQKAYDALHARCVDLHYRSCSSGVGSPWSAIQVNPWDEAGLHWSRLFLFNTLHLGRGLNP